MLLKIAATVLFLVVLTGSGCNPSEENREEKNQGGKSQPGETAIPNGDTLPVPSSSPAGVVVLFPEKGGELLKGETYTLKWEGGAEEVSIFLVDSALEPAGVSVSISDRVYGIENKGSYRYKVPERLEEGTYKFAIGEGSSPYFKIVSP